MKIAMPRSKWFLPAFCVAMGVVLLDCVLDRRRRAAAGSTSWRTMTGFGLVILLAGRSETVRGLRGDGRDERFRTIDIHATAFAGTVLVFALIGAWVVELARGHDGSPYGAADGRRRPRLPRGDRVHALARLSRLSKVGSSLRRGGRTSRHVHCSGSLSSRKRMKREPWRKRLPCTLS